MQRKPLSPRPTIVRVVAAALSAVLALGGMPAPALAEAAEEASAEAMVENAIEASNEEAEVPEDAEVPETTEVPESEEDGENPLFAPQGTEDALEQDATDASQPTVGGAIPIDIDVPSITEGGMPADAMVAQGSLPEAYNSQDHGRVTSMKDQSVFGICWSFSTIAALESSLIATGQASSDSLDLSERHLAYFNYHQQDDALNNLTGDGTFPKGVMFGTDELGSDPYLLSGGNFYNALRTLASWEGAADESTASYDELIEARRNFAEQVEERGSYPYGYRITSAEQGDAFLQATALDPSLARDANTAYVTGYRVASLKTQADVNALKQAIIDYGGAAVQINTQAEFRKDEFETSSGKRIINMYDYDPSTEIDHEVEIIGWDDNYDRYHFGAHELYNRPNSAVSTAGAIPLNNTLTIDNSSGESSKYAFLRADHQQEGRYKIVGKNCNVAVFRLTTDGQWEAYVGRTADNSSDETVSDSLIVESFGNDTHLLSVTAMPGCTATVSIERVGDLDLTGTPEHNGAWLAKNSWGGNRETGYVWISYEDVCLSPENGMVGFAVASTERPYDNNYQYDGSTGGDCNSVASGGSISNVYEAKANEGGAEQLKAVSLCLDDVNVDYAIQVYANPTDPGNPTSGTPLLSEPTTGRTNFMGHYTIELNEPVYMREGNSYAMVATLSHTDGSDVAYSVESSYENSFMRVEAAVHEGQSFERDTADTGWDDLSQEQCDEGDQSRCCARIKAFTDNIAVSDIPTQSLQNAVISIADQAYTGAEVKPSFTVKVAGTTLVPGIDYDVAYDNNVNIGRATVTVTGKDRYTDSKSASFNIIPRPVTVTAVDASKTYGTADPTFAARVEGTLGSETVSYEVRRVAGENAGTYAITPSGAASQGNYTVTYKPGTFTIKPLGIGNAKVTAANQTYTGKAIAPAPSVTLGTTRLVQGTDYTVGYKNNVNAGRATVTVTGKGNYTGAASATFSIVKAASRISLAAQTKTYNGKAIAYSGKVTRSGSGGKVTYRYYADAKCTKSATPKAAGTYWVRATLAADANHNGATSAAAKLTVSRASLAKAGVARVGNQPYTGKAVRPSPKVTLGGATLRAGTDYTLSYRNNVRAGTATVTVTGRGNYSGTRTATFRIVAPSVQYRTHVQSIGDQAWRYNGAVSGTFGKAKRLEGIWVKLPVKPVSGSIQYKTHVQSFGWEKTWRNEGAMSGTKGKAKRLEAIQIRLTGNMAKSYDVYYRVHAQTFGWMGWAKNGAQAGTAGYAKRLEGIQILVLPKGSKVPSTSYGGYKQATAQPFRKR